MYGGKKVHVVLASTISLALGFTLVLVTWRTPEITPAMRGKEIAGRMGCFACHGPEGQGGTADPISTGGQVPGWDPRTVAMYATSTEDIREWTLHGVSGKPVGTDTDPDSLIPMPAYEELLTEGEVDDLLAYFEAVVGWDPHIPPTAREGRHIAARLGCFGCHGPSGMGGLQNPRSLKGHIPAWDGEEFAELVRDETELREWILDGRIERLWTNPAARRFLEGQTIHMPAYREHISGAELDRLVAYIQRLRKDS